MSSTSTPDVRADRPPSSLQVVRVILWLQAVATVLMAAVTTEDVYQRFAHGQEVNGVLYLLVVLGVAAGVVAGVCAIGIVSHRTWPQPTTIGVEVVAISVGPSGPRDPHVAASWG